LVVLKALFWFALAAEVAWLIFATAAEGVVSSVFDRKGEGLVHLLILGALALFSGLLVLAERCTNTFNEPERQWTLAETLYAVVLFCSLFFGIYAFFGWYFA
jgi:hypothetical protein